MAQAAQREVDEQIRQQKKVKPSLLCAVLPPSGLRSRLRWVVHMMCDASESARLKRY